MRSLVVVLLGLMIGLPACALAADDGVEAGLAAELHGDLDGTIRLMSAALASPNLSAADQAAAHAKRGDALREQGKLEPALADLDMAIKLAPEDADAYLARGLALGAKGRTDAARADIDKARMLSPKLFSIWFNMATAFHGERNFAAAVRAMDKVLALTPDDPVAHNERGVLLAELGRREDALSEYAAAIALKPDYPEAYYNRGLIYEDREEFALAVADFDKLVRLKPNFAEGYEARGLDRFALGDFAGSAGDFERGLALDPLVDVYRALWLHLARARQKVPDDTEFASNVARFNVARWPGPVVELFLGKATPEQIDVAAGQGDPQDLPGQHCDAAFYLGEFALAHNEPDRARRELEVALRSCPHDSFERFGAGAELRRLKG
jgi:lipoprotein NlpI